MQFLTVNQIRKKFLDFFVKQGHTILPSFPLVPKNDNSLLLINSGMAPMKAFFTGQEQPPSKRVATCQKCIRTTDIDDVGKDARHGSFFEMLGNFSFGDYFKKEVIPWAWAFLTVEIGIPAEKLSISVYEEDDEAFFIWRDTIGIPEERIFKLGKDENFWEHGVGPCGPCSEIHYDRGEKYGCGSPNCTVGCDCDRFMEIWNLVFTQFEKNEDGSLTPLKTTNIDTGMGLERLAIVLQDAPTIFDIDNIKSIRNKVIELSGIPEEKISNTQLISANIITDHVRSVVFMAADGVLPSNEGRGYALRRLLRRAIRHGLSLQKNEMDMPLSGGSVARVSPAERRGLEQSPVANQSIVTVLAQASIDAYSEAYSNLLEKQEHIINTLAREELRFMETLETGMKLLNEYITELKNSGNKTLSGEATFKLYDTYGFPSELTREILEEQGFTWDEDGFLNEMQNQKKRAREARGTSTYMGADETVYHKLPANLPTEFVGYETLHCEAEILAIISGDELVEEIKLGQEIKQSVALVLNKTPFYAASGGQQGDIGYINALNFHANVTDTFKVAGNNTVHLLSDIQHHELSEVKNICVGKKVLATVSDVRSLIASNHTATHLLQATLREVLGSHVEQAGSDVTQDKLRFDFTHPTALTPEEREQVELLVNLAINDNRPVIVTSTTPEEARKKGALALFGEKYGDIVRMISIEPQGDAQGSKSVELCGGTHVNFTGEIKTFKILSETGISSGVRRIEAVTNETAMQFYKENLKILNEIAEICKVKPVTLSERIKTILEENKQLKKELSHIQGEASKGQQSQAIADILKSAIEFNGFALLTAKLENYDVEALRQLADKLKTKIKSGCMLLCGINEAGAAMFLASATDDAVRKGIHAGNIVKEAATLCGGGGGGRPNHAQAGGKDISRVNEALEQAIITMKKSL